MQKKYQWKKEEQPNTFNLTLSIDEGGGLSKKITDVDYLEKSSNKKNRKVGKCKNRIYQLSIL